MHQVDNDHVPDPAPEGMEVLEANGICTPVDGSEPFTVKMRVEFPEGHGAAALESLEKMAAPESLEQLAFELALRGDESCQRGMLKIFEDNTGDKVDWEQLVKMLAAASDALAKDEGK